MKTFKQHLLEKTFDIDEDVDYIYNKAFKDKIKSIQDGTLTVLKRDVVTFSSSDLKSDDAKKAHEINPVKIEAGIEMGRGNSYNAIKKRIDLHLNSSALAVYDQFYGDFKRIFDNIPQNQVPVIKKEYDGTAIRASIYHELSHWLDDTFHGQHILKMTTKADTFYRISDMKRMKKVRLRGETSEYLTDYEVNAQVHAIKQLKKLHEVQWKYLNFDEMLELSPSLNSINKSLTKKERYDWMKKLKKRLHREKLLGRKMK